MAFFKMNIVGVCDNVERFIDCSYNLKEQLDLVSNSLIGADAYWNDINCNTFISKVKQDKFKLDDYIIYLNNTYKELRYFSESIRNVCNKYGYNNVRVIKFDDSRLSNCNRYLQQAIEILNINLSRLNSLKNSVQYASLSSVYAEIANINHVMKLIGELKSDISNFCSSINVCLSDSRSRKNKIDKDSLDISIFDYNWKVTQMKENTVVLDEVDSVVVCNHQLDVDSTKKEVDLGYNSVNYTNVKNTDINYNDNNNDNLIINKDVNYYNKSFENSVNIRNDNNIDLNVPKMYDTELKTDNFKSSVNQYFDITNVQKFNEKNSNFNLNDYNNVSLNNVEKYNPVSKGINNNFNMEYNSFESASSSVSFDNISVNNIKIDNNL